MHSTRFALFAIISSLGVACVTPSQEVGSNTQIAEPTGGERTAAPMRAPALAAMLPSEPDPVFTVPPSVLSGPSPLVLDACDESAYEGARFAQVDRNHVAIRFIPGTVAERDLEQIATARNAAFEAATALLGLVDVPRITVVMSPNRVAATHHGLASGAAFPASNQVEVLYLGTPDARETMSPGHELAHVIASKIDGVADHLPILSEGLAVLLDGSGRDPHASYAASIRGGVDFDTGTGSVTRFTWADVLGDNHDRAGSFVKFLIDRYGVASFKALWKAAPVTLAGWGYTNVKGTFIYSQLDLEKEMNRLTQDVYGVAFDSLRLEWEAALKPYLAKAPAPLGEKDLAEIQNLLAVMDQAQTSGDAEMFRTAMEGFYCDAETEASRLFTARAAVERRGSVKTTIVSAVPTGTRNYATALIHTTRKETRGEVTAITTSRFAVEHFPAGWRVTLTAGL